MEKKTIKVWANSEDPMTEKIFRILYELGIWFQVVPIRDVRTIISIGGRIQNGICDDKSDGLGLLFDYLSSHLDEFNRSDLPKEITDGKSSRRDVITFVDDSCPFCCSRQQVDGNTEYLKIVVRTYGSTREEFTDETIFTGSKFQDGSEHNEKIILCQCPRCAKEK